MARMYAGADMTGGFGFRMGKSLTLGGLDNSDRSTSFIYHGNRTVTDTVTHNVVPELHSHQLVHQEFWYA